MWRCVAGIVVPDVSKETFAFIFKDSRPINVLHRSVTTSSLLLITHVMQITASGASTNESCFSLQQRRLPSILKSVRKLNFSSPMVTVCIDRFNIQQFTLCPHCINVFCIYLRKNSDLCHLQHKLIGFYNRDEKCLQRGTDWVFK